MLVCYSYLLKSLKIQWANELILTHIRYYGLKLQRNKTFKCLISYLYLVKSLKIQCPNELILIHIRYYGLKLQKKTQNIQMFNILFIFA